MLRNFFSIAIRNVLKHKGFTFINIAGLAIGLAAALLILLWVQDEFSYEKFNKDAENIFRVEEDQFYSGERYHVTVTPFPSGPVWEEKIPEIKDQTRINPWLPRLLFRSGEKVFFESSIIAADSGFLKIFTFPLISGDPETVLNSPYSIIITEKLAEKYFGRDNPVGKTLTLENRYQFTITGVIKNLPKNTLFSDSGLLVKCYSAEKDIFLEEISGSLSKELKIPTTLDTQAQSSYSYGVGGALAKERFSVYNHHAGNFQKREIYVTGCQDASINDDPFFTKYTERHAWHGLDKILISAKVNHGNSVFEYTNPGIKLKTNTDWFTTVTLPGENFNLFSYYRCPVDTEYRILIDLKTFPLANAGKQVLWLRLLVHDIDGKILRIIQSEGITLSNGNQKHEAILKVPPIDDHETIYSDLASDKLVNISVEASFSGMESGDVAIKSIILGMTGADGVTTDPGLIINNVKCSYSGSVAENEIIRLPLDPGFNERDTIEVASGGMKRLTFLVRHTDLEWQVRNAAVKDYGKYLEIKKIRNRLSDKHEIIIVPLFKTKDPYVHRVRNSEGLRIYPLSRGNKTLGVEIDILHKNPQIEVFSIIKPVKITNVSSWEYEGNIIKAEIKNPGTILFHF